MKVLLALEHHFRRNSNGQTFVQGPIAYNFLRAYTEVFDEAVVLARVAANNQAHASEARADGPGVNFWPLPDYLGPWQYFRALRTLQASVREAVRACDAYILRVPGLVGRLAWKEIRRLRRPYAVEVVGDPWEALGPGTWPSLLRPAFRLAGAINLRAMCRSAAAAHYVTRDVLQRRFPPAAGVNPFCYSDAELSKAFATPDELSKRARRLESLLASNGRVPPLQIGFIGSFAQMYKGPDVLLRACQRLLKNGALDWRLSFIGDGAMRPAVEELATSMGLKNRVSFLGQLPHGDAIYRFLDEVDLFVLPSRTEGLPRVLLEAMARGCPCIGSAVGGIPELLVAEDMFEPNDAGGLAEKITDVLQNPRRMLAMSRRSLAKANEYRPEVLAQRRAEFYREVRRCAEMHTTQAVAAVR